MYTGMSLAARRRQHAEGVGGAGLHRGVAVGGGDGDDFQLRAGQGQQYGRRVVYARVAVYDYALHFYSHTDAQDVQDVQDVTLR